MKVQTWLAFFTVCTIGAVILAFWTDKPPRSSNIVKASAVTEPTAPKLRSNASTGMSTSGTSPADREMPLIANGIAVSKAAPRGTVFNFSCGCCGDTLQYAAILKEKGLTWPRVWEGLEDSIALNNLQYREEQAILRIAHDAEDAVKFFEQTIAFERDNYDTRRVRGPWDVTRSESLPAGDPSAFSVMLQQMPERHFEAIIMESMPDVMHSRAHIVAIYNAANTRPVTGKLRVYALFADMELLKGTPESARILKELRVVTGRDVPSGESWLSVVNDYLSSYALNSEPDHDDRTEF